MDNDKQQCFKYFYMRRGLIEGNINAVARGQRSKEEVLAEAVHCFRTDFMIASEKQSALPSAPKRGWHKNSNLLVYLATATSCLTSVQLGSLCLHLQHAQEHPLLWLASTMPLTLISTQYVSLN